MKPFLGSFFIALAAVFLLYVVIDLSTNLGDFLEAGRRNNAAFVSTYYLYRLPLLFPKLCPLALLLASAFTLTYLEKRNELTPIKASGISLWRLTWPLFFFGALLAALSLAAEQWLVPWAATRIYMENLEKSEPHLWHQLIRDEKNDRYLFYVTYFPARKRMERIYISSVDDAMREREFVYAEVGTFAEADGGSWILENGYRIRYDEKGFREGPVEAFDAMRLSTPLRPSDMESRTRADEMSLSGLRRRWRRHPSFYNLGVRLHFRAAFPASNVVLLLFGLPVVLAGARRRYLFGAMCTILLAGAYFLAVFLGLRLGMGGALPPFLAGWGPPALFGALAASLADLMPT